MPTATPTPTPTPTMNAIPVTMTFWFPVMSHPNPMSNPTATPSPSPSPSASPASSPSSSPSPSPSARSPFQSPQPNGFFHPLQAMMQAFLSSMAASNTSTPTPPPSPSPSQSTASSSPNDFMSSIPLPQLLNMFWSMQGINGQPMDLSTFMQGGGNKPTPSTAKHIIEHLPKYIYHTNHKPIPSTSTCSVCQDDFNDGDEWTQLPCHHPYHTTCIQPWLKEKHTCPSCRYPLETDDTEFNNRVVYPEQRTWKHTPHVTSTSTSTCSMSHIHHTSCQLLSGNTSMLTLSCGHPYHLECLDTAQRVLHSSSTSTNPQTVVCPMCHAHQAFPVHLSELMRITTPTTTTSPSTTSPSTPISPKAESPKDIDIPFDYPMTSEAPTSSPSLPPTSTPSSVPISSLHGSAQIEDATDTEMTDA